MKWNHINKENYPSGIKVLGTDKNNNISIGYLFPNDSSSTGFVLSDTDNDEIDCIAFQFLNQEDFIQVHDTAPQPTDVVIFYDESTDKYHLGTIEKLTDWTYIGHADDCSDCCFIESWYKPEDFTASSQIREKVKKRNYMKALPLAALTFLCLLIEKLIGLSFSASYVDFFGTPIEITDNYDGIMYELEHYKESKEATEAVLNQDDWMKNVDFLKVVLNDNVYNEPFNRDAFYVDVEDNWHYEAQDGYSLIMTADGMYVVNPEKTKYKLFEDYLFCFMHSPLAKNNENNNVVEIARQHCSLDSTRIYYARKIKDTNIQTTNLRKTIDDSFNEEAHSATIKLTVDGNEHLENFENNKLFCDTDGYYHYNSTCGEEWIFKPGDITTRIVDSNGHLIESNSVCVQLESENHYKLLYCSFLT